jgi:hypothetical protein
MPSFLINDDIHSALTAEGYTSLKVLPCEASNGKHLIVGLRRFIFTVGMCYGLEPDGYSGRYCFPTMADAKDALSNWNGELFPPGNWIKHKGFGGEFPNPNSKHSDLTK